MRKMMFIILAIIINAVVSIGQTQSTEEVWKLLEKTYNLEKVELAVNESENHALINFLTTNSFISSNVTTSELNLFDVTKVHFQGGISSFGIPFNNNPKYMLTISFEGVNYSNGQIAIVKNNVDSNGNGNINTLTPFGSFTQAFVGGVGGDTTSDLPGNGGNNCYRDCWKEAYEKICDDFFGCVALHTNLQIQLVVAAWCLHKCNK